MGGKAAGSRKGRERGAAWSTAASRWKQKPEGTGRSTPGQRGSALPRPRSSSQSLHEEPGKRDGVDSSAPPPTAGRGGGAGEGFGGNDLPQVQAVKGCIAWREFLKSYK